MEYENIEYLIEDGGEITVGRQTRMGCVAIANDEHNTLAMLKRKPGETMTALLERLDSAVYRAMEYEEFIDEINP